MAEASADEPRGHGPQFGTIKSAPGLRGSTTARTRRRRAEQRPADGRERAMRAGNRLITKPAAVA